MEDREIALDEIYNRIVAAGVSIGIKSVQRAPMSPLDPKKFPCISLFEGPDEVVKVNSRGVSIYPARRLMEVVLELSASDSDDMKVLYQKVRTTVLANPILSNNTFISELRTEGPMGYDIPNTQGMRLVLALVYTDEGLIITI